MSAESLLRSRCPGEGCVWVRVCWRAGGPSFPEGFTVSWEFEIWPLIQLTGCILFPSFFAMSSCLAGWPLVTGQEEPSLSHLGRPWKGVARKHSAIACQPLSEVGMPCCKCCLGRGLILLIKTMCDHGLSPSLRSCSYHQCEGIRRHTATLSSLVQPSRHSSQT